MAEVISWFLENNKCGLYLAAHSLYVLQLLNIIHVDLEFICYPSKTYVGKPEYLYFIRQRKKSKHWHRFGLAD
jgi:hypothetical protein